MANGPDESKLKPWRRRIGSSNDLHKRWSDRFQTDQLEDNYDGIQGQKRDSQKGDSYVVNLFFAGINIRTPALLFGRPKFLVEPRLPRTEADPATNVVERARLRRDLLNTTVSNRGVRFAENTLLALQDSQFRFGVIEVGYEAITAPNPLKGEISRDPTTGDVIADDGEKARLEPDRVLKEERVFVKYIPSRDFRVPSDSSPILEDNPWCGYKEEMRIEDIVDSPGFSSASRKKMKEILKSKRTEKDSEGSDETTGVWRIWDLREKRQFIFSLDHGLLFFEEKFKFLPFADLRFHPRLKNWYPLPPTFPWISPQKELNETRTMQKAHRKKAVGKYEAVIDKISPQEIEKLELAEDQVIVNVQNLGSVAAIQEAPLSREAFTASAQARLDWQEVSGITAEQRAIADAETATQATILDQRSRIRETQARFTVAEWLGHIGWLVIETIVANMSLKWAVQQVVDPLSEGADAEEAFVGSIWKEVTHTDLGELDVDVSVEIEGLSPVSLELERNNWMQVLALLTNPALVMLLGQSNKMLVKTLRLHGITSGQEVLEIQKSLQSVLQLLQQAGQNKAGGGPGSGPGPGDAANAGNAVTPEALAGLLESFQGGGSAPTGSSGVNPLSGLLQ